MRTSRFNLNLLYANQANKELLVNENMNLLDLLIHPSVKSQTTAAPPSSPAYGDIYIIPDAAPEWGAAENSLAIYIDEWIYLPPKPGITAWLEDDKSLLIYTGEQWVTTFHSPS